jgi:hypothetical protein
MPTGRLVGVQRRDELVTNDRRRVTEGILGHGLRRMETAITSAPKSSGSVAGRSAGSSEVTVGAGPVIQ